MGVLKKLCKIAPPGYETKAELNLWFWGVCGAFCWSLGFFFRFMWAFDIYEYTRTGERVIREGAVMAPVSEVIGNAWFGFALLAVVMLFFIYGHYSYHYRGSKSIYLMRRLPDGWELHRRCLTLPLLGAVTSLVVGLIIMLLYLGFYVMVVPDQCLPPELMYDFWRCFYALN